MAKWVGASGTILNDGWVVNLRQTKLRWGIKNMFNRKLKKRLKSFNHTDEYLAQEVASLRQHIQLLHEHLDIVSNTGYRKRMEEDGYKFIGVVGQREYWIGSGELREEKERTLGKENKNG